MAKRKTVKDKRIEKLEADLYSYRQACCKKDVEIKKLQDDVFKSETEVEKHLVANSCLKAENTRLWCVVRSVTKDPVYLSVAKINAEQEKSGAKSFYENRF